jgi:hypothetical protein
MNHVVWEEVMGSHLHHQGVHQTPRQNTNQLGHHLNHMCIEADSLHLHSVPALIFCVRFRRAKLIQQETRA